MAVPRGTVIAANCPETTVLPLATTIRNAGVTFYRVASPK
jgi:hypothetical protein